MSNTRNRLIQAARRNSSATPARPACGRRILGAAVGAVLLLAVAGGPISPLPDTQAAPPTGATSCGKQVNNTFDRLLKCVTLNGVRRHLQALQAVADANNGSRVSGTAGYDDSADYAEAVLRSAGYLVTRQDFEFDAFIPVLQPLLEQVAPLPGGPVDTLLLTYSGSGDVTAAVTALPGPGADATPGCDAGDFAGFPAGNIALISRGVCTFAMKATHAFNAGASGVVIYNNVAGPFAGTLQVDFTLEIGVTAVAQDVGLQLAAKPGLVMRLKTEALRGTQITSNLIAESKAGDPNNVVMVGAHLDSPALSPGLNTNGSGVAAVLETAVQMARVKPRNKLRIALWGAHMFGYLGSQHYLSALSQAERERIALYLNFDQIGSANHVFFVYDGDDSDSGGGAPGPEGSEQVEQTFQAYFNGRGLPFLQVPIGAVGSDQLSFASAGIPIGGLATGGSGIKTAEQAALWGGTAGVQHDPCALQPCDSLANVGEGALAVTADGVAYATLQFAMSTRLVNGRRGQGNFEPPASTRQSVELDR